MSEKKGPKIAFQNRESLCPRISRGCFQGLPVDMLFDPHQWLLTLLFHLNNELFSRWLAIMDGMELTDFLQQSRLFQLNQHLRCQSPAYLCNFDYLSDLERCTKLYCFCCMNCVFPQIFQKYPFILSDQLRREDPK